MAAKNLRRDFLGVEINESYRTLIETRVRRAEAWAAERDLFDQMMDES